LESKTGNVDVSRSIPRVFLRASLYILAALLALLLVLPLLIFLAFVLLFRPLREKEPQGAGPPIRSGTARIEPDKVVAGCGKTSLRVTYAVGKEGIGRGGSIRLCPGKVLRFTPDFWKLHLQWANGWGQLQRRGPQKRNYVEVHTSAEGASLRTRLMSRAVDRTQVRWLKRKMLQRLRVPLKPTNPEDVFLQNQKVTVTVERGQLSEGDEVVFELGKGTGLVAPVSPIQTDFAVEVDSEGGGEFRLEEVVPSVDAVGGEPACLEVVCPSIGIVGRKVKVLVRCTDAAGYLTDGLTGRLLISSAGTIQAPSSVVMRGPESVAWFQAAVTGPGIGRIRVAAESGDIEGISNPVLCRTTGPLLLWGDIHSHSLASDGTREPWYYYHRARNLKGWDFTAVPDHDIWSLGEEFPRTKREFNLIKRESDTGYAPGEFVTFTGFEWTQHYLGHRVVYFGPGEEPVLMPHTDPVYATPDLLLEALSGKNALVVPHHPAWKTHAGEMYFDFGPRESENQRLIEVYSRHGNSEFYGCPRSIDHASLIEGARGKLTRAILGKEYAGEASGSYVRDALGSGYRFGLIAGSDEHLVATDPRRGPGQLYGGGITGLFAPGVTREAAWDALWKRRVSGTTGARIIMELLVDGCPQGSELVYDGNPSIAGYIVGTAPLELVELVKHDMRGYRTIWQDSCDAMAVRFEHVDADFRESSFYYLRVLQIDGEMGWAGPVWVDRMPKGYFPIES
jgi:hypothetical protein